MRIGERSRSRMAWDEGKSVEWGENPSLLMDLRGEGRLKGELVPT